MNDTSCVRFESFNILIAEEGEIQCKPAASCTECLIQGPRCTWCIKPVSQPLLHPIL